MAHVSEERQPEAPARPLAQAVGLDLELRAGLLPEEAVRRAERAMRVGDLAARVTCFYLGDLAVSEGWKALGHPNLRHFARHRLKRGKSTVEEYVKTGLALREPWRQPIDLAFAAGELCYSSVKHLVKMEAPAVVEEWVEWARGRSSDEVGAEVRRCKPDGRPGKGGGRRIHEERVRVTVELTATQVVLWERAVAKLQAQAGGALTNTDVVLHAARLLLDLEPDGSVPGWKRVNAKHYQIHASPAPGGDPDRLVTRNEEGDEVELSLAELTRDPLAAPAARLAPPQVGEEGAVIDPRNHGPEAPEGARDVETSAALRTDALVRDGYRCLVCGGRKNLTVHHVHWRRYGGRTELANLATACETCHSMIHARLLIAVGDMESGLRFLDRAGRPFAPGPVEPVALVVSGADAAGEAGGASQLAPKPLELRDLPAIVDAAWLRRHAELFDWNERLGALELRPGVPRAASGGAEGTRADAAGSGGEPPRLRLGDLVGQERVRERLTLAIAAARERGDRLLRPHVFSGGPGLGKTTLAEAVAGELQASLVRLPAPQVGAPDLLLRALAALRAGQVLFMDELQALDRRVGEALYEALDGGVLSLPLRAGLLVRPLRVRLEPFTFLGATTDEDQVSEALRSRLTRERLSFYSEPELAGLLTGAARAQGLALAPAGAARLARASRGTPREGLRLLAGVRDEATLARSGEADAALVERALERREIDAQGLDPLDRAYLAVLERADGPVALRTLAAELGAPEAELRQVREPWLQRLGLIQITPRGRVIRMSKEVELS